MFSLPLRYLLLISFFASPMTALAQGRGQLGELQSLQISAGSRVLSGRDSGMQLIVTGHYASQERDLTHEVHYVASPKEIVRIDSTGHVVALQEGVVTIRAVSGKLSASLDITVKNIVNDVPINFKNDVVPIFTRFGCNAGSCHGKSGGQNGFALSLLGFEPDEDYESLVKEARGRRVMVTAPESSLLLMKASGRMPHGGGIKLRSDSPQYRIVQRWIEQATPMGRPGDATVVKIEMQPRARLMAQNGTQQLQVIAHCSDGSFRDVTRLTQFESNDADTATVSETGVVQAQNLTGSAAIMARFLTHVDVFRATIPLDAEVAKLPAAKN